MATLEMQEVIDVWESIKPAVVIPMHFKTERCTFPRYSAEDLVSLRPAARKMESSSVSLAKDGLPVSTEIMILEPSR